MVGAGGSGSIFLSHLCRIWQAWTKLGGDPFTVTIYDPDLVSEANLARQCFCEADIGAPKAQVLAQRLVGFFGVPVTAEVKRWKAADTHPDVIVGCVDNIKTRKEIHTHLLRSLNVYWLDLGNSLDSGQVVLGGHGLPDVLDLFPELATAKEDTSTPSCSMAEALLKQDLFINSTLANFAGQLLWQLMRRGGLNHHGYFVNLGHGRVQPIDVPTS